MKIFDDNIRFSEMLEHEMAYDATYINLNMRPERVKRQNRPGLDIALDEYKANPNTNIVLYSFESAFRLFLDNRFQRLMARKNVNFINLRFTDETLEEELALPKYENHALSIASNQVFRSTALSEIRHAYTHRPKDAILQARESLNMQGSDDDIRKFLESRSDEPDRYTGKIPGLFVDIEGTLVEDGELRDPSFLYVIQMAQKMPVTFWTGSDVKEITKKYGRMFTDYFMSHNSVLYRRIPILHKGQFKGSSPEIVYDNMPKEKFEELYGIKPEKYVQVT